MPDAPGRRTGYTPVGFTAARAELIACLRAQRVQHEPRDVSTEKNLLAVGEVTIDFVIAQLRRCRGGQYRSSAHHRAPSIEVHEFFPGRGDRSSALGRWYIKAYFLEGAVFISVHEAMQGEAP